MGLQTRVETLTLSLEQERLERKRAEDEASLEIRRLRDERERLVQRVNKAEACGNNERGAHAAYARNVSQKEEEARQAFHVLLRAIEGLQSTIQRKAGIDMQDEMQEVREVAAFMRSVSSVGTEHEFRRRGGDSSSAYLEYEIHDDESAALTTVKGEARGHSRCDKENDWKAGNLAQLGKLGKGSPSCVSELRFEDLQSNDKSEGGYSHILKISRRGSREGVSGIKLFQS